MADPARARLSTSPPTGVADGSSVPARLRIVGWIVLATALGLAAVVVTLRSTLAADAERSANAEVVQEVDEFRTFTERGRDPETGLPFATAGRLLQVHLERQYPGGGQVLVGYDRTAEAAGRNPLLVQGVLDRLEVSDPGALVRRLAEDPERSGTVRDDEGDLVRWGRAEVQPGGAFLVLQTTGVALDEVGRIVRLVLLVSLLGLVATAGIAWAVAGQILAPVRTVRRAASRITRADLSRRIEVRGRDDVAALATVFNAMLDRLQAAFGMQQRLTSAAGAHVRPPLAVLRARTAGDPEAARALDQVAAILDDLDLLAAAEAPAFVEPAPVDVGRLTDDLCRDVVSSTGRRCHVVERVDAVALLDGERVSAALLRLVRNADQASPPGAPLRVGSRFDGDAVELFVSDDGPGLPPETAARVLDRFAEGAPTGSGPGLGLAVVRAVADAHDGSAWVESEPGRGSAFGLRLPVRPAPTETTPVTGQSTDEDDDSTVPA